MRELQELEDINPQNRFILQGPLHGQFAGRKPLLDIDAARNAQGPRQNQQNAIVGQVPLLVGQGTADGPQRLLQAQRNGIGGQGLPYGAQDLWQAQNNGVAGPLQRAGAGVRKSIQGQHNNNNGQKPPQPQREAAGQRKPLQNLNNGEERNAGGRQQGQAEGRAREGEPLGRNQNQKLQV
ncbi:uncharacterized protein LOC116417052 [Nasonia vitripennis]|uniref:Uncharacterized protein n=1 Tax=Nasonia vitripennis TaxID=7425 RepID=A0A7M7Q9I0_NASVI|nr:uncharacterized protein LOC116417052 [Nasonia vitripennis]